MAKARAIIKRRQSVQNIRKITRTMELIATARFKKALDRAVEAETFTRKIAELVAELSRSSAQGASHPLLETRPTVQRSLLLVLTSNRGLAGGYNSNVLRVAYRDYQDLAAEGDGALLEVVGKRGVNFLRFRGIKADVAYTNFDDRPQYDVVEEIANKYIDLYLRGQVDRVDVAYTRFFSTARQEAVVTTLLPMSAGQVGEAGPSIRQSAAAAQAASATAPAAAHRRFKPVPYEFLPDPKSILDELVPVSFKVRLFKCFLDAAVSEQIARMVAMRGATENGDQMIKNLTRLYNRARQSQITRELAELVGGAAALE